MYDCLEVGRSPPALIRTRLRMSLGGVCRLSALGVTKRVPPSLPLPIPPSPPPSTLSVSGSVRGEGVASSQGVKAGAQAPPVQADDFRAGDGRLRPNRPTCLSLPTALFFPAA